MKGKSILYSSVIALFLASISVSCSNKPKETESNSVTPSEGDVARYNLSPQQEMTMQNDTMKTDSTTRDTLKK